MESATRRLGPAKAGDGTRYPPCTSRTCSTGAARAWRCSGGIAATVCDLGAGGGYFVRTDGTLFLYDGQRKSQRAGHAAAQRRAVRGGNARRTPAARPSTYRLAAAAGARPARPAAAVEPASPRAADSPFFDLPLLDKHWYRLDAGTDWWNRWRLRGDDAAGQGLGRGAHAARAGCNAVAGGANTRRRRSSPAGVKARGRARATCSRCSRQSRTWQWL